MILSLRAAAATHFSIARLTGRDETVGVIGVLADQIYSSRREAELRLAAGKLQECFPQAGCSRLHRCIRSRHANHDSRAGKSRRQEACGCNRTYTPESLVCQCCGLSSTFTTAPAPGCATCASMSRSSC